MASEKSSRYWKSWEQGPGAAGLVQISGDEFSEPLDVPAEQLSRRSFLKAAGFTAAIAALEAGCSRAPVEKAIPYLIQPEEIVPGVSYYYASGCGGCPAACGALVKNRDGRPIKLEGNPDHPISRGGLCAVGQAALLGLYDSQRLKEPRIAGRPAAWDEVDRLMIAELARIRDSGGAVRFLSATISSPTLNAEIQKFLSSFPDSRHVMYDAVSSSAILDAHQETHGARLLPHYRFDRAEVIASFDADFLGTWISPVEFTAGYRAGRRLDLQPPQMSYHAQWESRMSLTGAKADRRVRISPEELPIAVLGLANRLAHLAGVPTPVTLSDGNPSAAGLSAAIDELAQRLWDARGRSLVVCGSQDRRTQVLVNFINHTLGNYGATLDIEHPSLQKAGNDRELEKLLEELHRGTVAALFICGANPVYDLPGGAQVAESFGRTRLVVSFAERLDETASLARFVCPDHHTLESWGDAEPVRGTVTLFQPALHPLGNTRATIESLAAWRGTGGPAAASAPAAAYELLREHWREHIFPQQTTEKDFQTFWDRAVEAGYAEISHSPAETKRFRAPAIPAAHSARPSAADEFSLVLYPKPGMLDGRHAHNPWLQELPDPVTKIVWDNYACLSPRTAMRLGIREGDVIRLEDSTGANRPALLELPAFIQPGQYDHVIAVALGYGRKGTERFATIGPKWWFGGPDVGDDGRVGKNAAPLVAFQDGTLQYTRSAICISKTGRQYRLASTQSHHTLTVPKQIPLVGGETREIVREMSLAELLQHGNEAPIAASAVTPPANGLWPPDHLYTGHRWGMAIDLTACTGCSACVVACQAENNIPVVGKDEVLRHREMHWIRIDRYYAGEDEVDVLHQPLLCQQCDNAPCETVCPVLATVHSSEGLNQQIYNRCVGTRYCANNCPYKVRRFNWFNYAREDRLQNLALNPDVTVRSRGVMEKCTFCVQRIEAARMEARRLGIPIADGQIQAACQQSCPAQAIAFGDLNDPKSRVSQLARDGRRFGVLEEFNFRPSVNYLAVVRNRESEG